MTGEADTPSNPSYQLTETAEGELALILDEIASKDGVQRALHVWGKFEKAFELLAFQPRSGVKRPKLTGERVRWWFVFKWIVIYDPDVSPTSILRVIYGPRELDELLGPDEFDQEDQ